MATISDVATSFDLPQYIGDLFQKAEKPNSVLRLIGGLTGQIRLVGSKKFPMGVDYEIPSPSQPSILEGAAPTPSELDTAQSDNLVQIFQESVGLTYSALGQRASVDGIAKIPGAGEEHINQPNTVEWQIDRKLELIARQANLSFLKGTYQEPADNTTARQTRGVYTAVTTNVFDVASAALDKDTFENGLRDMMVNGAFNMGEDSLFVLGDAVAIQKLANLYTGDTTLPESRTVAGVAVRTIVTQWGTVNLVWEPDMDADTLFVFQPRVCRPVAMPIPNKGVLFVEPLAKTKSQDEAHIYGELGIDYRHEIFHGSFINLG